LEKGGKHGSRERRGGRKLLSTCPKREPQIEAWEKKKPHWAGAGRQRTRNGTEKGERKRYKRHFTGIRGTKVFVGNAKIDPPGMGKETT